ncbi:MAG: PHP domain-containing protein [Coleofasciculaceae cyanobacterium RL_1_1]|nr:PHP domain-containing protein [Coleofasciculaceae cyanobacterium RL_1_1]
MASLTRADASSHLAAREVAALQRVFHNLDRNSCPTRYNFHMHSVFSDGQLQADEILSQVIAIGLEGFAITDHHSVLGYHLAQSLLAEYRQQNPHRALPKLWSGVEINAELLGTEVHILGYGFDPYHVAMQRYLQGEKATGNDFTARYVIDAIHSAHGLAVLAHPCRYRKAAEDLIPAAAALGIDGTEAFYAYRKVLPWAPSEIQTELVSRLNVKHNLFSTCGTDTHGCDLLSRV